MDVEWQELPVGIPVEAVPFLLRAGGFHITVAEAQFCWKVKQAAPDIPPNHATALLRIFQGRFPREQRGEAVDHSDIWQYLAGARWVSSDEDGRYISGVVHGWWPPLDLTPPNLRDPYRAECLRSAYKNLEIFLRLEPDFLDPLWMRLWQIHTPDGQLKSMESLLFGLPVMPWDPRSAWDEYRIRHNREDNKARLEAQLEHGTAEEIDPTKDERRDES